MRVNYEVDPNSLFIYLIDRHLGTYSLNLCISQINDFPTSYNWVPSLKNKYLSLVCLKGK